MIDIQFNLTYVETQSLTVTPLSYRVPTYWHGKITTISQRKGNIKNQHNNKGQNYRQIILWNIDSNKNIFILPYKICQRRSK